MYKIVKGAIQAGGYKLADMQERIKGFYARGEISEQEKNELIAQAAAGADAEQERPALLALICNLVDEVNALSQEVAEIKAQLGTQGAEEPDTDEDVGGEEVVTYPAWKAWDGISRDYQMGAIVSHNGKLWQSVTAAQNVWEPGTPGTEAMWVECTPEEV